MNYNLSRRGITILLFFVLTTLVFGQNISLPRPSQYVQITERVGISDIIITYHSPVANGRQIWGGVVPFGRVWRAGANENTTISFTHDAFLEGKAVPAGTYGLYMFPKDKDNFRIILSKYSKSWGTVAPKEDETVLIADVTTNPIPNQNWLSYDFKNRSGDDATVALRWGDMEIPFKISFDVKTITVENARAELKGVAGFSWQSYFQAADYCLDNDINLEEAMTWIDRAIFLGNGSGTKGSVFPTLMVKAGLLEKAGNKEEAKKTMDTAIEAANGQQLNQYGYQLIGNKDFKKAIEIFTLNITKNPNDPFLWGYMDSLGEAYLGDGNNKMALKYYKEARKLAPANQHAAMDQIIAGIESK